MVVSLTIEMIKNTRMRKEKSDSSTFNIEGLPLTYSYFE